MKTEEGRINVGGHQVWYRRVGEGGIPLLILHGGPGGGNDSEDPSTGLAADRPVIYYDQLGCGKSDKPDDPSLWRIERFAAEVGAVRQALGLEHIHLLGHSWGGWLAIEYMMSHPKGVVSLILYSTSAGTPQTIAGMSRLRAELPVEILRTLQQYESMGDYSSPQYWTAVLEFYKRHICRLDPWPDLMYRLGAALMGNASYETMWGPNEFVITGNLKDWDRTSRLGEISVPTLITLGRYDEVTPDCAETLHRGIPNSQMVIFENSAHMAHLEETERFLRVVAGFMRDVEAKSQDGKRALMR